MSWLFTIVVCFFADVEQPCQLSVHGIVLRNTLLEILYKLLTVQANNGISQA